MQRILVVDDEEPVRNLLTTFLEKKGYMTADVETGPLALAQLNIFKPHMVLLDIRMAGLDGLETLKKIKNHDPDLPVIMVTGENDDKTAREAMENGALDYITKPFNLEQLQTNLTIHLMLLDDQR